MLPDIFNRVGSGVGVAAISALLAACSNNVVPRHEQLGEPVVSVEDSSGVEMVSSSAPRFGEWQVGSAPSVVVGGAADPAGEIVAPVGAGRLPDGSLVGLDRRTDRLLRFDRSGNLEKVLAARGRGPGELSEPEHLQVSHDTIAVWEARYGKVVSVDGEGRLLAERWIDLELVSKAIGAGGFSESFIPGAAGSMLAHVSRPAATSRPEPGELVRRPVEYVLITAGMTGIPLGQWPGLQTFWVREGNRVMPAFPLVPLRPMAASGRDRSAFVVADGELLEVKVYDPVGELWRIVRWDGGQKRMDRYETDSIREWLMRHNAKTEAARATLRRWHRELPPQTHWPATGWMVFDDLGCLWVQRPGIGWDVFDRDGVWIARAKVPLDRLLAIGEDWILGMRSNADDGRELVELSLRRTEP